MKLTDILRDAERADLLQNWDSTPAAEGFDGAIPPGEYVARIVGGELFTARTKGTPGYKLAFQIVEGPYMGRRAWLDLWLTTAALPLAKRDLAKIGVKTLAQLEGPPPEGIRCVVKVALRREDDGTEYNRVRSFEVVGIDLPEQDPFAPEDPAGGEVW